MENEKNNIPRPVPFDLLGGMPQMAQWAKDRIKEEFDEEIEVEFVKGLDKVKQRMAELAKQYDTKIGKDIARGLFIPASNGYKAIMLVGYEDDEDFRVISVFYHELQHAIDYFEVIKALGEQPPYFRYFTEYNAVFEGSLRYLRYMSTMLNVRSTDAERRQFITNAKAQHVKILTEPPYTILDILLYLAKVPAFARIEGSFDHSMLERVPNIFKDIANFIHRYEPTKEWYAKFKEMIDGIPNVCQRTEQ